MSFSKGQVIKTAANGASIKIIELLGSGVEGEVYKVEYCGEEKALKWYTVQRKDPEGFYKNLEKKINIGAPDPSFLWPEALTEKTDGSYGYIMPLMPDGYHELSEFMFPRSSLYAARFESFKYAVDCCINITNAYRNLHAMGYSFQYLDDGNLFINPDNGDVKIADNDNVAANGTLISVMGKMRYMAPEIVYPGLSKANRNPDGTEKPRYIVDASGGKISNWERVYPSVRTDNFSMAVIFFIILTMGHPLEGRRTLSFASTDKVNEKNYGSKALFVYDKNDDSNRPVPNVHKTLISRWEAIPEYVKQGFHTTFSQEAIRDPNRRLAEVDWLKILLRFRNDIVKCKCGEELILDNSSTTKCPECNCNIEIKNQIKLPEYNAPIYKGTRIYRAHLDPACNTDRALNKVVLIVENAEAPGVFGMRNKSGLTLEVVTSNGDTRYVEPDEVVPIKAGIKIRAYDNTMEII